MTLAENWKILKKSWKICFVDNLQGADVNGNESVSLENLLKSAINCCLIEAVDQRCSLKKVFLEILQNSQENTCAWVSFLIKLQASGECNGYERVILNGNFVLKSRQREKVLDWVKVWVCWWVSYAIFSDAICCH